MNLTSTVGALMCSGGVWVSCSCSNVTPVVLLPNDKDIVRFGNHRVGHHFMLINTNNINIPEPPTTQMGVRTNRTSLYAEIAADATARN